MAKQSTTTENPLRPLLKILEPYELRTPEERQKRKEEIAQINKKTESRVMSDLREGLQEMVAIEAGKTKGRSAYDLLNGKK